MPPSDQEQVSAGSKVDWDLYRALREQWTHEDNLINHRMTWLILSNGLLLTAYGVIVKEQATLFALSLPTVGMFLSFVVGAAIYAALAAMKDVRKRFFKTGLEDVCHLSPKGRPRKQGKWAAYALPVFFFLLWFAALFASHVAPSFGIKQLAAPPARAASAL